MATLFLCGVLGLGDLKNEAQEQWRGWAGREVYSALDKAEVQTKLPAGLRGVPEGWLEGRWCLGGLVCFLTGNHFLVGQGRGK